MSESCEDGKDWRGNMGDDLGVISNKWNETADVVIIGSGFAGLAAAIEAKNAGASIIILEKMKGYPCASVLDSAWALDLTG